MEDEFYQEKETLESTIEQYKQRLQQELYQSNMADLSVTSSHREKDETIAQLEERVIENDSKLCDLKVSILRNKLFVE